MGIWTRLFNKPKTATAYYFWDGDQNFHLVYTKEVFYDIGEWWISLEDSSGKNVFHWPFKKLNADPASSEVVVRLLKQNKRRNV
jgi:hypothetical protein